MKEDMMGLFDDAADTVRYTSQGTTKEIQAIAELGSNDTYNIHDKDHSYTSCVFTILDDEDAGITAPTAGDDIELNGTHYTFVSVLQHNPGALWRLRFSLNESAAAYDIW